MTGAIITVGDELLIGQVVNTNSSWLATALTDSGVTVTSMVTVADDVEQISASIRQAMQHNKLVIVTGGLGPTHDDVTREGVAAAFDVDLRYSEETYERIAQRFIRRGRQPPESNKSQAMIPHGFEILNNEMGSAPGLWRDLPGEETAGAIMIVPGVPREMKWLFESALRPRLVKRGILNGQRYRTFSTTGIGESNFQDVLRPFIDNLPDMVSVAYLPNLDGVRLRLGVPGADLARANKLLDECETQLRNIADQFIYSTYNRTLEQVVVKLLHDNELTLSTAESCTGGLISSRVTDVAGSSDVLIGGVVAYSNEIKSEVVGVDKEAIRDHGAVSSEVAAQMASGIRERFGTDIGLATTGIMGPGGGTESKPVGTVWFGIDDGSEVHTIKIVMGTERLGNKRRTSTAALNLVRKRILKTKSPT